MQYQVSSLEKVDFGATGVNEILQNVAFIISTVKYSCPLDREFGWIPDVDSPINLSIATNTARILEVIQDNEPRVIVDEITTQGNALDGNLEIKVRVRIDESI